MSRRVAFTALLAVLAWSLLAAPAAQGRTGRHCAYRLVTVERIGNVNVAEPELIGCYSAYADALAAGSSGSIRVSSDTTPLSLRQRDLTTGTRAADVLLGTEFNATGYLGTSKSYFGTSTCSDTSIWEINYVGDTWNDKFASGKGFGGCDHNKKFQDADFGGNVLTCTPNCTTYGALADEVSSLRWRP